MREILFRGKRIDNGEWVYGYFVADEIHTYIFEQAQVHYGLDLGGWLDCCQMQEVIPETVGQFTGLTDKNDNLIFEGDILESDYDDDFDDVVIEEVVFFKKEWMLKEMGVVPTYGDAGDTWFCSRVIGNVHDNPELLEVEHG